jgi:hypothetical protein
MTFFHTERSREAGAAIAPVVTSDRSPTYERASVLIDEALSRPLSRVSPPR